MTFGEKVRIARTKLNITQDVLAERVGVSRRVITSYETDKSRPRGTAGYQRLADALEVNINYLLQEEDAFIAEAEEQFGYRGKKGAEKLLSEVTGLFAGGDMAEEDMDELMLAIQEAYILAKKRNKKYAKVSSQNLSSKRAKTTRKE